MSSPELWKRVWDKAQDQEFWWWVHREQRGVRGTKISHYIERHLGPLSLLKTIEVGSGAGVYSLVFASRGAKVTLLDYCSEALALAQRYFLEAGQTATFLLGDALQLDESWHNQFDVAMSFGTIEHFRYPERFLMAKVHCDLVRAGGVVVISVPNRWFLPHELMKAYLTYRGKWSLGYEGSFTRGELLQMAGRLKLKEVEVRGSALRTDLRRYLSIFANSRIGKRFLRVNFPLPSSDRSSFLDDFFGADLVLLGCK